MHICKIEELMNPWHSTDPDKPCPAGCEKGHMPEKAGEYWAIFRFSVYSRHFPCVKIAPCIAKYSTNFKDWIHDITVSIEDQPVFWRIPDGHPPIPEE